MSNNSDNRIPCRQCQTVANSDYGRSNGLSGCTNCSHCGGTGFTPDFRHGGQLPGVPRWDPADLEPLDEGELGFSG